MNFSLKTGLPRDFSEKRNPLKRPKQTLNVGLSSHSNHQQHQSTRPFSSMKSLYIHAGGDKVPRNNNARLECVTLESNPSTRGTRHGGRMGHCISIAECSLQLSVKIARISFRRRRRERKTNRASANHSSSTHTHLQITTHIVRGVAGSVCSALGAASRACMSRLVNNK